MSTPVAPAQPQVSVIVPHYNDLDGLKLCLASLAAQRKAGPHYEIIVCDNNSPLPSEAVADAVGSVAKLVVEETKGAGPTRNRAAAEAQAPVLAFIDSDCIADPNWLAEGLAALSRADIVGGRMEVFSTAETPSGADLFEQIFAFDQKTYVEKKGFSVTANLFCRRDVFDAVGPFQNGVSEDLEWCRRAAKKGYKLIYASNALVRHPTRPDWPSLVGKWRRITQESYLLARDEGTSRAAWLLRQIAVVGSAVPHSLRVMRTDLPLAHKGKAIATLFRLRSWRALEGVKLALARYRAG